MPSLPGPRHALMTASGSFVVRRRLLGFKSRWKTSRATGLRCVQLSECRAEVACAEWLWHKASSAWTQLHLPI